MTEEVAKSAEKKSVVDWIKGGFADTFKATYNTYSAMVAGAIPNQVINCTVRGEADNMGLVWAFQITGGKVPLQFLERELRKQNMTPEQCGATEFKNLKELAPAIWENIETAMRAEMRRQERACKFEHFNVDNFVYVADGEYLLKFTAYILPGAGLKEPDEKGKANAHLN